MSGNPEEEKDTQKAVPLDLVRTQISTVVNRSVESTNNKAPLMMTSQALRSVRVLTQGVPSSSSNSASVGQTIITGLVQGTVIKQDANRAQIKSIVGTTQQQQSQPLQPQVSTISVQQQRPAQQITLSTTSIVAAAPNPAYHVPRGPAVVANLAAPRSNVTTIRTPLVVGAQTNFVRPPRTLSPAQAATWLTNANNANSLKTGVLSSSSTTIRATTITGNNIKSQTLPTRPINQISHASVSSIRAGTLISNAINIGQTMHTFKPASGTTVQLNNTVTLAQMLPSSSTRTQALVYSGINSPQFNPAARITITTTAPNSSIRAQHPNIVRPPGAIISGTRLTVPIAQVQAAQNARIITPSVVNQRIPVVVSTTQPVLATTARLVTTQASGNVVGRLAVNSSTVVPAGSGGANILTSQTRISTLSSLNFQSLMAVANGAAAAAAGRVQQGSKVITQPATAIHLAQIPSQIKSTSSTSSSSSSSSSSAIVTTGGNRTVNVPASIVAQRANSQAISIGGKVFATTLENPVIASGATSVFIHTPLPSQQQRHSSSPNPTNQQVQPPTTSVPSSTQYSISNQEGNSFYYDNNTPSATVATTTGGNFPKTFVAQSSSNNFIGGAQTRPNNNNNSQQFQGMRFSSVMVLDQSRGGGGISQSSSSSSSSQIHAISSVSDHQSLLDQQQTQNRVVSSSPRPSILRKRDHEGAPLKAAKNLSSVLLGLNHHQQQNPPTSPLSPQEPDSRENGHSSGGSTTISATSSPGLPEINEENSLTPINIIINNKDDDDEEEEEEELLKPPIEMSPRKKPRKQQLTGNDMDENHDDMQFISDNNLEKKGNFESDGSHSDNSPKNNASPELSKLATLRKRNTPSLLNGYRQTWKATHNHFQRYSDVKPKAERRPTIIDLANQNRVLEKINGWKIYHLSTQMEDLAGQEHSVHDQLSDLLKYTESEENTTKEDKEVNRVNELIKGNLQRIKIINDGMLDAKCQIMKVIDHKRHVNDILSRCVSKRNFKKREKS